jgi:hypothetical protein
MQDILEADCIAPGQGPFRVSFGKLTKILNVDLTFWDLRVNSRRVFGAVSEPSRQILWGSPWNPRFQAVLGGELMIKVGWLQDNLRVRSMMLYNSSLRNVAVLGCGMYRTAVTGGRICSTGCGMYMNP